jgi:2-oxoglutarate ferredoxin oxidoreductase subunit alpha
VYAPSSVQEAYDLTQRAFDTADKYRNPVMVLGDGVLGQMMEPLTISEYVKPELPDKDWAATGWKPVVSRPRAELNSLYIKADECEAHNLKLEATFKEIEKNEQLCEELYMDGAEYAVVAYGITARIALAAVRKAREEGVRVGLIRPITVWPFPHAAINAAADRVEKFLVLEMSLGQMVEDVRLAVNGKRPVSFYGRTGGIVPGLREFYSQIIKMKEGS